MATQVFWQFVNQSYNTAMNYANRNGTDSDPTTQEVLTNYAFAVGVSSGLSMGLRIGFEKSTFMSESTRKVATMVRFLRYNLRCLSSLSSNFL